MPVAKSYQELEIVGDVFVSSGRQYVNVKLKSGKLKSVRWYSNSEYQKMYPDAAPRSTDLQGKSQKEVLGFTNGYITIFKGDTYSEIDWFRASPARYARPWGWYIVSTEEVPEDLPKGIEPVRLAWELVGTENGTFKAEHLVKEAAESVLFEASESEYVGAVGERLELFLTVEKNIELDNNYGRSSMHLMRDDCGNLFVWTTASKSWAAGTEHHIRGTVKEHRTYKGEKQTVLTRCLTVGQT